MGNEKWGMTVASSKLRLFRRFMPHIPLRYMWGFQQFTLLRSVFFRDQLKAGLGGFAFNFDIFGWKISVSAYYLVVLQDISHIDITTMDEELKKNLSKDTDGLLTYEYIANHISDCECIMDELVDNMIAVDQTGQFTVSAARYLHAIDKATFASQISRLIAAAIEKDREHRYLADLLQSIWGDDYEERVDELNASDNNFRRIYKRLHPAAGL